MKKSFAVFDIDGTLIRWQLYHAIADALARNGHIDPATYSNIKEARMDWKRRVHQDAFRSYEAQVIKAYDAILKELPVKQFNSAVDAVFDEYKDQVYTYTRELIAELKSKNYLLFAISGSQTEVVDKIASYYGFDDWVGSVYPKKDGRFTGDKILTVGKKDALLKKLVYKHNATFKGSVGVGDTESDIAILSLIEQPIAFNPSQGLFNEAQSRGWPLVIERKNVVYRLESSDGSYVLA